MTTKQVRFSSHVETVLTAQMDDAHSQATNSNLCDHGSTSLLHCSGPAEALSANDTVAM